ncbi:MAG TPA: hypothetical protein VGD37_35480 [Kofleriaceae bacterium]|jgi:hypothetical protein
MGPVLRRLSVLAVAAIAVGAVTAWRGGDADRGTGQGSDRSVDPATPQVAAGAAIRAGSTPAAPSENRTRPELPGASSAGAIAVAAAPDRIAIDIEGAGRTALTSAELAHRASTLEARDRRAWRLSEIIPDTYIHSNAILHAMTIEGGDYILNGDGRRGDDAIVVRRNNGEMYLAWLEGGARGGRPLADAERPAERIEHVARITLTQPERAAPRPAAQLTIIVDGVPRRTLTAASFAAAAQLTIGNQRDGRAPAIDVAHAFGGSMQVAGLVSDGAPVTAAPPADGARAVIYMNRRARFKFAWIDAAGQPIGAKQREVSEISLRSAGVAVR